MYSLGLSALLCECNVVINANINAIDAYFSPMQLHFLPSLTQCVRTHNEWHNRQAVLELLCRTCFPLACFVDTHCFPSLLAASATSLGTAPQLIYLSLLISSSGMLNVTRQQGLQPLKYSCDVDLTPAQLHKAYTHSWVLHFIWIWNLRVVLDNSLIRAEFHRTMNCFYPIYRTLQCLCPRVRDALKELIYGVK